MTRWLLLAALILLAARARADPWTTLQWTNPRFQAAVDDSGNPYCDVGPDSLKTLHSIEVWGQPSYGGGFKKLTTVGVMGREGLVDSVKVDRLYNWAGWHYYVIAVGMSGRKAPCPSNLVYVPGSQVTGVDLPPLVYAEPIWFDVQGRKVRDPRDTGWTGIRFFVWRVRGQIQKPAASLFIDRGVLRSRLPVPRWAIP